MLILTVIVLHKQVREIGLTGVDMVRAMTSDDAEDLGLRGVTRKVWDIVHESLPFCFRFHFILILFYSCFAGRYTPGGLH